MASKTKTSPMTPSYVEFEPYCDWQKEERVETLIIHLPAFKREQLKVQVTNQGVLKVSGDRPTNGDGTRRSRFIKEARIPQGCNINEIRAKFMNGRLHVTMPKKIPTDQPQLPQEKEQQQQPEMTPNLPQLDQKSNAEEPKAPTPSVENSETAKVASDDQAKDHMFGLQRSVERFHFGKKIAVNFGVAVVVMVAIGAYVAYKFGSDPCSEIQDLGLN